MQVYWRDIGGQEEVKERMKEAIEWPLKHPQVCSALSLSLSLSPPLSPSLSLSLPLSLSPPPSTHSHSLHIIHSLRYSPSLVSARLKVSFSMAHLVAVRLWLLGRWLQRVGSTLLLLRFVYICVGVLVLCERANVYEKPQLFMVLGKANHD